MKKVITLFIIIGIVALLYFPKSYSIKKELMGGEAYYMIYEKRFFIIESFYERWNTEESAKRRLDELMKIQL